MKRAQHIGTGLLAMGLAASLLFGSIPLAAAQPEENAPVLPTTDSALEESQQRTIRRYAAYLKYYPGVQSGKQTIELDAAQATSSVGTHVAVFEGRTGIELKEKDALSFTVTVEKSGFYYMDIAYYTRPGSGVDSLCAIQIDGELPFAEAEKFSFNRLWRDALSDNERLKFDVDLYEDEIVPSQEEVAGWQSVSLTLMDDYSDSAVKFYLSGGTHTVTLAAIRESLIVGSLTVRGETTVPDYAAYRVQMAQKASANAGLTKKVELEHSFLKSSNGLSPYYDRSSPVVTPNDASHIQINAIGGYGWRQQEQWISWEIEIPADGWYTLSFHYQQSAKRGMASVRALYVDDTLPYKELASLEFSYGSGWQTMIPTDENNEPYQIYLTGGRHTLKMVVRLGESAQILGALSDTINLLNDIYRDVIMITGTSPDTNRDYYIDREIPTLMANLQTARDQLKKEMTLLYALSGDTGSKASYLQVLINQLETFLKDPRHIPEALSVYQSNITVLADILLSMQEQPLVLDYLWLTAAGTSAPEEKVSFWERVLFRLELFVQSFVKDYSAVGGTSEIGDCTVRIWVTQSDIAAGVSIGRDQAKLLQKMIGSGFTAQTGIRTEISLVNSGAALVQAIVSGTNPDIVMFVGEGMPVILAVRDAAEELSGHEGYDDVISRFSASALVSFQYNGGVYAVPDIQMFYMLYYRQDIFEKLNMDVPETWDEFYAMAKYLQHSNLQIGIAGGDQTIFETLLLQNGSNLYTDDLSRTCLTDTAAVSAFTQWTKLYTQYGLDVAFDFLSRFRSGEMPLGIMPLTMYNTLSASAPEIRGLWSIAPIPGLRREDGTVVRQESCSVTGSMILKNAQNKDACFRFLDWWTQEQTQIQFGIETEATLGVANRYFTANQQAFANLPWTAAEAQALEAQWADVTDIAQTPASYFVSRCITNAFRNVVYYGKNPREILTKYAAQMDDELEKKRHEFDLE